MKKTTRKLMALLLALALAASMLSGCTGSGNNQSIDNEGLLDQNKEGLQDHQGGTGYIRDELNIAFTGATSLSPWGTSNNTPGNFEVYECLFTEDINGEIYPVLADATRGEFGGYDHEEGSTLYTVYIWDYIHDHNGNAVTADDVKFSFDYQKQNAVTSGWEILESVEVVDATTINFKFTTELTAIGAFEQIFTMCFIIDKDTFNTSPSQLLSEMIGTGPYKMAAYTPGNSLTLERYEDYWQTNEEYRCQAQAANVQTLNYKFINDSNTRIMMFTTGELDLSDDIETQYVNDFLDGGTYGDQFNVFSYPAGLIMTLWANCSEQSICGDINMRKAIFYAISTDDLVAALGGTDQPAYTFANDTTVDWYEEWNEMDNYNSYQGTQEERTAKVKEYLDAAGYNGEKLTLLCQNDMSDFCAILINMLSTYGINAELHATDHAGASTLENDPTAWDLEYGKWGGNPYVVLKWIHAFDWANTKDGNRTTNFVTNQEWQELLYTVNTVEGHTVENMTRWLEILYENAYATNLYNTTKSIIYPDDLTYMYRNAKLVIVPGACEFADPNA